MQEENVRLGEEVSSEDLSKESGSMTLSHTTTKYIFSPNPTDQPTLLCKQVMTIYPRGQVDLSVFKNEIIFCVINFSLD
jgi:hypothetical protein